MLPEFANYLLQLTLSLALVLSICPLTGTFLGKHKWMQFARSLAYAQCLCLCLAYLLLAYAFLSNDFSVMYVATNSNSQLPWYYRLCAVWGAHEGSLLLWVFLLSIWTAAVARFSRHLPLAMVARVLSVLGMISVGFLLFIIITSNPFLRLLPDFPLDGRDLNPLLQDPGLIIHPPMLYLGYVGFSVAFAFAIAALIGGRLDAAWARWSKPWTLAAWCFLTLGIILGSWWAYRQLGWGGWWFWDPVENASFLPWLVGTALIHSLVMTEKRNAFKAWTALLAILTFSLSLVGTFLVRSGILISVHAFAVDPSRGVFMLIFLVIVIGASLTLYAWRVNKVKTHIQFSFFSRENLLLANNMLLTAAMLVVLLGTLYPLFMDALGLEKISVGPPYFNLVFIPLMSIILCFMGVVPLSQWHHTSRHLVTKKLSIMLGFSLLIAFILPWMITHVFNPWVFLGMSLALWVVAVTLQSIFRKTKNFIALKKLNMSQWGMVTAHIGVALCVIGVVLTSENSIQREIRLSPGETTTVGDYQFRFVGVQDLTGPNYTGAKGKVVVEKDMKEISTLQPEVRFYTVQKMALPKTAIDANLFRDLYVALGEPLEPFEKGDWSMRIYYKPFVRWIWGGALLMIFGGVLALLDRRYRHYLGRLKQVTK
ncbi:MAG: Cytochrome c heme lyase subunit CcmF [Gammaproteobacteria bacterium]|nr:Cytochrome c heme lyase subunit CcmF [Gammaproteobacteria bacterium]